MASKIRLAEQIILKLYGRPSVGADPVQPQDVILAIGQAANTLLKAQGFETLKTGENAGAVAENLSIFTYPKQPLVSFGGRKSKCTLPAKPVSLIRNLGVFEVSSTEDFTCPLIPMMAGQAALLHAGSVISDLLGQYGYELYGNEVVTTSDLTIDGIDGLYFRLVGVDIDSLGDYDPLPLSADLEAQLIAQVYSSFVPPATTDKAVDNYQSTPQSPPAK